MSDQHSLTSDTNLTPKTDAAVWHAEEDSMPTIPVVDADFARDMERSLNEALHIIRDYFWVESRKQGRKMDERANAFLIKMGMS